MEHKESVKDVVKDYLVEQIESLDPDAVMLCVRQVKKDGKKQWHYFYMFDDDDWGTTEDVVGAVHILLDLLVERNRKRLKDAKEPNKG